MAFAWLNTPSTAESASWTSAAPPGGADRAQRAASEVATNFIGRSQKPSCVWGFQLINSRHSDMPLKVKNVYQRVGPTSSLCITTRA